MKKRNRILFPTDFSKPAANAFRYALLLADKMDATIQLLHVMYPQGESLDFPVMVAEATQLKIEASRKRLNQFIEKGVTQVLQQISEVPDVVTRLEIGTPVGTIKDIAERDEIDIIMMGSRGENKSRFEKVFGSVSMGVVRGSACPVLVIPEDTPYKKLETIVYASNVMESDPFEIWKSLQLLKGFEPVVHCVHFNYNDKDNVKTWEGLQEMKDFFERQRFNMRVEFHHLPGTKIEDDLNDFIKEKEADMLVMFQPEHSLWDRLFKVSSTRLMALHSEVPLLVLKR